MAPPSSSKTATIRGRLRYNLRHWEAILTDSNRHRRSRSILAALLLTFALTPPLHGQDDTLPNLPPAPPGSYPPPPPGYSPASPPMAGPPPPVVVVPPPPVFVGPPAPPPLSPAERVIYAPFYAAGLVLRYGFYYLIVVPLDVFGRALTYGVPGGVDQNSR